MNLIVLEGREVFQLKTDDIGLLREGDSGLTQLFQHQMISRRNVLVVVWSAMESHSSQGRRNVSRTSGRKAEFGFLEYHKMETYRDDETAFSQRRWDCSERRIGASWELDNPLKENSSRAEMTRVIWECLMHESYGYLSYLFLQHCKNWILGELTAFR